MRKRFEANLTLGATPISEIKFPIKYRDKLTAILLTLHSIYINTELSEKIFLLLENKIISGKKNTGRPGMDLWNILVLGVIRVGMSYTYDEICYASNYDTLLRQLLGINDVFYVNRKEFSYRTIHENISKFTPEMLDEINVLIADYGSKIIIKKRRRTGNKG